MLRVMMEWWVREYSKNVDEVRGLILGNRILHFPLLNLYSNVIIDQNPDPDGNFSIVALICS